MQERPVDDATIVEEEESEDNLRRIETRNAFRECSLALMVRVSYDEAHLDLEHQIASGHELHDKE